MSRSALLFKLLLLVLPFRCLALKSNAAGAAGIPLELWPEGIPGQRPGGQAEESKGGYVFHVRHPTLTAFLPPADRRCGTAVVYCPGGGYLRLPVSQDGGSDRRWLNDLGVAVFVLRYRFGDDGPEGPLRDILRAIRIVRSRAQEFGVRPDQIGVYGGSAGGHVVTLAGTLFAHPVGMTGAALDRVSGRPDFVAALFPMIVMGGPYLYKGGSAGLLGANPSPETIRLYSTDEQVSDATPPTFLAAAEDDHAVPVQNSLLFYGALCRHHVPAELHLFEDGGHGFHVPTANSAKETRPLLEAWLRAHRWIPAAAPGWNALPSTR